MISKTSRPSDFYRITCDERAATLNTADLYERGVCAYCGTGCGPRLATAVRQLEQSTKHDLIYTINGILILLVFSEALRDELLKLVGLSEADFAPTTDASGRALFELKSECIKMPWVGLNEQVGIKAKSVYCPECGSRSFIFAHRDSPKGIRAFIRRADAVAMPTDIAIGGIPGAPQPLFAEAAYTRLSRMRRLTGIKFEPVGVVAEAEIEYPITGTPVERKRALGRSESAG